MAASTHSSSLTVAQKVTAALAQASSEVTNSFLTHALPVLGDLEALAASDAVIAGYLKDLSKRADNQNLAIEPLATHEFLRVLGEAHFYLAARERGVTLQQVPQSKVKGQKRPDFKHTIDGQDVYFEVKTLSVDGGDAGLMAALLGSLEAHVSLEEQQKAGRRIATAFSVVQPFGTAPYANGKVKGPIGVLIDKFRSNLKRDQFQLGPTFLVLNLSLFPFSDATRNLRPTYWDSGPPFPLPVTGRSWMLAFGQPGFLVHGYAEFEGKPAIDGTLDRDGILTASAFIRGLIILNKPWRTKAHLGVLMRSEDAHDEPWAQLIHVLAGDAWNDELDSNGHALNVNDPP